MGRRKSFDGALEILTVLNEHGREMSIDEIMEKTGLNWNAVHYWLRNRNNKNNLVVKGCVEEIRVVEETLNRAQVMYKYRIKNPKCIEERASNLRSNRES